MISFDYHFLFRRANFNNIEIDKPICIDDYECLEGLSEKSVTNSLKSLSASLLKNNDIKKIGIIIDQDDCTQKERFEFINNCIDRAAFRKSIHLSDFNNLIEVISDHNITLQLGCYFTNVDQQGELETVLKTIKNKNSDYADCLESWRNCLKGTDKHISDKNFDKFWISTYLRFDTCLPQESKQAGKKCSMSGFNDVLKEKSNIFDFEHSVLDGLKDFLRLFKD
jgi:hypothetical protein